LNVYQPANKIRDDELAEAQNVEIFENTVDKRFGTAYIGNTKDSRTRGIAVYTHSDGTKQIIRASGTTIQKYNTATGNFDDISGKTYTSDLNTDFLQAYDAMYTFNGIDNLTRYDKDVGTITTYTAVNPPALPSAARGAGLSAGAYTAHYVLSHYNAIGETTGTSEFTATHGLARNLWDGITQIMTLSWTNSAGAVGTNIFYAETSGDATYLDTVSGAATSYVDQGGELVPDKITEPRETNSTAGVIAYAGTFDGTRLIAFKDSIVFYSGGGRVDIDHFDSGSGGGAISVSSGDGDEIQSCKRLRDGSILICKKFSTWRLNFLSTGILPITLQLVNSLYGIVGKRAIAAVDDDYIMLTPYGVTTIGNQPNFPTDILRVASISIPVDKIIETITPGNLANVAMHYDFKKRLRIAYTEGGGSANNSEFIFKLGSWVINKGIHVNSYANMTDNSTGTPILDELNKRYTIYGSDDEGRVVQLDKGYSDRGTAIDAFFSTKKNDQKQPFTYKKYYDQDILLNRLQGVLTVTNTFDSGSGEMITITAVATGGVGAEAIGLSPVGEEYGTLSLTDNVLAHKRWRLFGREQKYIQHRVRENTITGTFSIINLGGVYRLKSRRKIDNNDILSTTTVS